VYASSLSSHSGVANAQGRQSAPRIAERHSSCELLLERVSGGAHPGDQGARERLAGTPVISSGVTKQRQLLLFRFFDLI
jgi:hypothetical protein